MEILKNRDASLLVVGNNTSAMFPRQLIPYTTRTDFGSCAIRVNFLVNYSWNWDLDQAYQSAEPGKGNGFLMESIGSRDVSRIDLVIRWGGRRRLSGFLPLQSVYADFYVINEYWPDFKPQQFFDALRWYENQDITLGG